MCSISPHSSSSLPAVARGVGAASSVCYHSKDPAYYKLYLQDVHAIFITELALSQETRGEPTSPQMYTPIDHLLFNTRLFRRIEEVRERAFPEGFGRGPSSDTQVSFNRMAFDVIKEIVAKTNDSTSLEYVPGKVPVLGFKQERLSISNANFISRIEPKLLATLFPGTTLGWRGCPSVEESVDQLAADCFLEELQGEQLNAKRLPTDPVILDAADPWLTIYQITSLFSFSSPPGLTLDEAREVDERRCEELAKVMSEASEYILLAVERDRAARASLVEVPPTETLPAEAEVEFAESQPKAVVLSSPASSREMPADASPATAGSGSTEPGSVSISTVDPTSSPVGDLPAAFADLA